MAKCNEEALGRMLYLTGQDMRNFAEKVLRPFDLTIEQMHLLKKLSCETGMTQKHLGDITAKTPANMTRMLDRLEAKGLIERQSDPGDRRALQVLLTENGEALIEKVVGSFESFSEELERGISEKEKETVKKVLKKMSANILRMSGANKL